MYRGYRYYHNVFLAPVVNRPETVYQVVITLWYRYARKFTVVCLQKHTTRLTGLVIKQTRK